MNSPFVNLVTSTNGWKDVSAYRLGVTYELSDTTGLRFGYSFDETPRVTTTSVTPTAASCTTASMRRTSTC